VLWYFIAGFNSSSDRAGYAFLSKSFIFHPSNLTKLIMRVLSFSDLAG
jgi:hypothetical protein